jgi:hypothetical protein
LAFLQIRIAEHIFVRILNSWNFAIETSCALIKFKSCILREGGDLKMVLIAIRFKSGKNARANELFLRSNDVAEMTEFSVLQADANPSDLKNADRYGVHVCK